MTLSTDLRYALRSLRAHPFHAIVAAGSLAIGVSTVTGIVTLRDASRNLSPVFPNAEQVVALSRRDADPPEGRFYSLNHRALERAIAEAHTLGPVALWAGRGATMRTPERSVQVGGLHASGSLPRVLGLKPTVGRLFTDDDGRLGSQAVVVLSHGIWKSRFGGDSSVAGRSLSLDEAAYVIIGVLPPGADLGYPVWIAKSTDRLLADTAARVSAMALLAADASPVAAHADVGRLSIEQRLRNGSSRTRTLGAEPLHVMLGAQTRNATLFIGMLGIIVALIAAMNFAALILARGMQRSAELGIRAALGASSGSLVLYLVLECAILGVAGGAAGAVMAPGVIRMISSVTDGMLPTWIRLSVTPASAAAGIATAVLLGVIFGLAPALELARPAVGFLRGGAAMIAGSKRQSAARARLVEAQVALATGVIVFIGAMFGSLIQMAQADARPEDAGLYVASMGGSREDTTWRAPMARALVVEAARAADGAVSAAVSQSLYLARQEVSSVPAGTLELREAQGISWVRGSRDFFLTVRPTLLHGRFPTPDEISRAEPVGVVTAGMQRALGIATPTGWRIRLSAVGAEQTFTVVGIVEDPWRPGGRIEPVPIAYSPWPAGERASGWSSSIWIRSNLAPRAAVPAISEALRQNAPAVRVFEVQSQSEKIRAEMRGFYEVIKIALAVFAIALGLAALGIYGIVAFGVTARRKEMAIRTALGGSRLHIARIVTREATINASLGLVAGSVGGVLVAAMLVTRPEIFTVPPSDVIGAAVLSVTAVVLLSSIVPIRRVWKTDCADALRAEG
jgi:putative ABC transport system permease protein